MDQVGRDRWREAADGRCEACSRAARHRPPDEIQRAIIRRALRTGKRGSAFAYNAGTARRFFAPPRCPCRGVRSQQYSHRCDDMPALFDASARPHFVKPYERFVENAPRAMPAGTAGPGVHCVGRRCIVSAVLRTPGSVPAVHHPTLLPAADRRVRLHRRNASRLARDRGIGNADRRIRGWRNGGRDPAYRRAGQSVI
ncbi:hypothetical protein DFQ28_004801 [Apophysomyces sp. BC1034]|nr:hypothetical protein DFQ30_009461 [Apophysomyces sp. BC1015]KAG0188461.1 hypothetical protein DFQ28_004801 [Apophysomyces sp. BC1034]